MSFSFPEKLKNEGWCFIPGYHYDADTEHLNDLREQYEHHLVLDPYSLGNRYRAYAQCRFDETGILEFGQFHPYQQTKAYNPDTGGVVREYPLIRQAVLSNPLFNHLIKQDIQFVKEYGCIDHPSLLSIGVHLFRYKATYNQPAYSSPIWLHRDDEDVVFVHLINRSENLLGGDNIIAPDNKSIEIVFRLNHALDTFVVNHNKYHAITPIGHSTVDGFSFRDIILVTFQRMETAIGNSDEKY